MKNAFYNKLKQTNIEEKNKHIYAKMKKEQDVNRIVEIINKQPTTLNSLEVEKLEKINSLLDNKIEELTSKIRKLNRN